MAYALLVDAVDGGVNRLAVIEVVDRILADPPTPMVAAGPDPDTWGTSPEQQAGQQAMMALIGGPAPMRQNNDAGPGRR